MLAESMTFSDILHIFYLLTTRKKNTTRYITNTKGEQAKYRITTKAGMEIKG